MRDGGCQFNMPHALTPHFAASDLNSAAIADDTLVAHALVLTAVALPVFRGTKYLFAKQAFLFRFQCAVVDGLRLLYFAF